jgi:carbonic anhydrase
MSKVLNEVLAANQAYSQAFGAKGELPLPPARQFAILRCMDARLDPAKYAELAEGDAHVIRNAGGRATDDAVRTAGWSSLPTMSSPISSMTISGRRRLTAMAGRIPITKAVMRRAISSSGTRSRTRSRASSRACRIREHPLVPANVPIYGYIYDVRTGRLDEVKAATAAGKSKSA